MASTTVTVAPGDDLYRLAAQYYGDASAWVLIAYANGLSDPLIQADAALAIPAYSASRVGDGVYSPPTP